MRKNNKMNCTAITLGCRLNQTDTALIFDILKDAGFQIVKEDSMEPLALIMVNTCAVTATASKKSRQAVRSLREKHPDSYIIVTGCETEVEADYWLADTAADLIIPNSSKTKILRFIADRFNLDQNIIKKNILSDKIDNNIKNVETSTEEPITFSENATGFYPFKSRANLKIQEGCDYFCSYCIVPYGRGKPRSRKLENTIAEFKQLIERGHKEIVLTGVNIATYNDNGKSLPDLIELLIAIPGDFRIRLSSTEPHPENDRLLKIMSDSPKLCSFLHLPLQHGTDKILKKMNRKYTRKEFANFIKKAKKLIPAICIGSDVIVGFPGETEAEFEECSKFIKSLPLSYLHVFRYSKRQGTPAANFADQVSAQDSLKRHKSLSTIGKELSRNFVDSQIGEELRVLCESKSKTGIISGWSDNYINIKLDTNQDDRLSEKNILNNFRTVKLDKAIGGREAQGIILP